MNFPKVLVGLSGNPEYTAFLDGHPFSEKVEFEKFIEGIGGTSVNIALQLRELGIPIHLVLTVGDDWNARFLEEALKARNLSCSLFDCCEVTSLALVELGAGQRRVGSLKRRKYNYYPAGKFREVMAKEVPGAVVASGCIPEDAPLVHLMFQSELRLLRVLNPRESLSADHDVFQRLLSQTDILSMNEGEFWAWTGVKRPVVAEDLQPLHDLGPKIVIVTKASQGAVLSEENGQLLAVPAHVIGPELDGTGAGDAFLAGFLSHYLQGKPLQDCLRFAAVVAGIKVTKLGGSNVALAQEVAKHWNRLE